MQSLIEAKVAGREVVAPAETTADTGTVVDLMAALRASVEAARQGRGEQGAPAAKKSPAAKAAAKKTPAKKAGASKTSAKKTSAASRSAKRPSGESTKKTASKRANARKSA